MVDQIYTSIYNQDTNINNIGVNEVEVFYFSLTNVKIMSVCNKTIKEERRRGIIFTYEEVDVIRMMDGSIRELFKSKGEKVQDFKGAKLIERYFWAREIEEN